VAKVQREEGYDADEQSQQNPSARTRTAEAAFTAKIEGANARRHI
jgi:hypothetical protein